MNALITASTTNRYDLAGLSDDALLAGTRRLVAGANHALAALLAHLAEVETRGIHSARACASLYAYCIYELRMSEDAAFRRAKAARLCRKFPTLFDAVAGGELHLTGLLMLGPHLTDENLADTLARAKHRTKREIQKLVRELDPLPDVPPRIEPLGPELTSPRNPTWSEFASALAARAARDRRAAPTFQQRALRRSVAANSKWRARVVPRVGNMSVLPATPGRAGSGRQGSRCGCQGG